MSSEQERGVSGDHASDMGIADGVEPEKVRFDPAWRRPNNLVKFGTGIVGVAGAVGAILGNEELAGVSLLVLTVTAARFLIRKR